MKNFKLDSNQEGKENKQQTNKKPTTTKNA